MAGTGSWRVRAALVGMGCAVLVLAEVALRWLVPLDPATSQGFAGAPPPFVREISDDGSERYVVHPARRHSFPPQSFSADRASGAALVFCIGGSSVYGYDSGVTAFVSGEAVSELFFQNAPSNTVASYVSSVRSFFSNEATR